MKRFKKIWLLFFLPVIIGLLINWLTPINILGAIWKTITWFTALFIIKVTLPVWGIIVLMLAPLLIIAALFLYRTYSAETYLTYTSDTFFGILWHWSYDRGTVYEVLHRCPSCKLILQPSNTAVTTFTLICSHCGFEKDFRCGYGELLNRVKKEIDRKIITEEYKTIKQSD